MHRVMGSHHLARSVTIPAQRVAYSPLFSLLSCTAVGARTLLQVTHGLGICIQKAVRTVRWVLGFPSPKVSRLLSSVCTAHGARTHVHDTWGRGMVWVLRRVHETVGRPYGVRGAMQVLYKYVGLLLKKNNRDLQFPFPFFRMLGALGAIDDLSLTRFVLNLSALLASAHYLAQWRRMWEVPLAAIFRPSACYLLQWQRMGERLPTSFSLREFSWFGFGPGVELRSLELRVYRPRGRGRGRGRDWPWW